MITCAHVSMQKFVVFFAPSHAVTYTNGCLRRLAVPTFHSMLLPQDSGRTKTLSCMLMPTSILNASISCYILIIPRDLLGFGERSREGVSQGYDTFTSGTRGSVELIA